MLWRQLECFISVCKHLNYSSAAKELYISQSVVSHHISNLEKEIGLKLLYRTSHKVQLTSYGQSFYEQLAPLVKDINNLMSSFDKTAQPYDLLISSTYIINYKIFTPAFNELIKRHPNITMKPVQLDRENAIGKLVSDDIEGCFCFEEEVSDNKDLKFYPLFQIRKNGFLIPENDPLAREESICYNDLVGKTVILPKNIERQSRLESCWLNIKKREKHLNIIYADDMLSAFAMVSKGEGISPSMDFMPTESDRVRLVYNRDDKISKSGFCVNLAGSSFYARELAVILDQMYSETR